MKLIPRYQKGDRFYRLNIESLTSDPEWQNYKYKMYPKNLKVLQDSMQNRKMGFAQRVAMLSQIIPENGGSPAPHGNGAHGLVGWRGGREKGIKNNLPKQIHRLMEATYNDSNEWTHSSITPTAKETQKAFRNTPNVRKATTTFMGGYVRPPKSEYQTRLSLAQLIKKHMK